MNIQAIFLKALLPFFITAQANDTFIINGKIIVVPNPKGFIRITDEMSAVTRLTRQMVDPMNDTLAFYILESEVPTAMAGKMPTLDRTFILKVNKQLRNMTVGKNDFSQLKEMTKRQNQQIFADLKSKIPEYMNKFNQGMSKEFNVDLAMEVSQTVPLEPHYEADNVLSYSMYINYGLTSGNEKTNTIIAATSTFLNASGTVLFLYAYGPQDNLEWTRTASKSWAESVMSSNLQPPEKSPVSRGFNWDKVMEKGLIGAIMGAITGLMAALYSVLKKKKSKQNTGGAV